MTSPNDEPVSEHRRSPTIEHLGATFLRNHEQWKDKLYTFTMGMGHAEVSTITTGDYTSRDIVRSYRNVEFIRDFKAEVPHPRKIMETIWT